MIAICTRAGTYGMVPHMSNQFYRNSLDALGMSIRGASRFLNIDPKTSQRYATGDLDLPPIIRMLLAVMVKRKIPPVEVRKLAGLKADDYGDLRYTADDEAKPAAGKR
jgi:hypothetical protein